MKLDRTLMILSGLILLLINFLTFHDILETHTIRDWLILLVSILVFYLFARTFAKSYRQQ